MIRILIADDQKQVREGFCLLLSRESDLAVVGQARDGQEAVELGIQIQPHVITMDIRMPRLDGLEATKRICAQSNPPRVLVVAMSWGDDVVRRALDCGATGYVAKSDAFAELPSAIRELYQGKRYFSQQLAGWRSMDSLSPSQ